VDSVRLLETINKEAEKIQRRVKVLLEVHVAKEDTKSGFTTDELLTFNAQLSTLNYVEICGLMGMATNTDDEAEWRRCFREIKDLGKQLLNHSELLNNSAPQISMGMSDDYLVAIEEGSTMVRIGSTIFGSRGY
jgi:pyridoxal phosphate enzyme (YggS family)